MFGLLVGPIMSIEKTSVKVVGSITLPAKSAELEIVISISSYSLSSSIGGSSNNLKRLRFPTSPPVNPEELLLLANTTDASGLYERVGQLALK